MSHHEDTDSEQLPVSKRSTVSLFSYVAYKITLPVTLTPEQLQYFNEFNEIFVLSLLILFTNLIARAVFRRLARVSESRQSRAKVYKFSVKKKAA